MKFSWGSISADVRSLPFRGFNFCGQTLMPIMYYTIKLISWAKFLQLGDHPREPGKLDPSKNFPLYGTVQWKNFEEETFTNFADLEPPAKVFSTKFRAYRTHL